VSISRAEGSLSFIWYQNPALESIGCLMESVLEVWRAEELRVPVAAGIWRIENKSPHCTDDTQAECLSVAASYYRGVGENSRDHKKGPWLGPYRSLYITLLLYERSGWRDNRKPEKKMCAFWVKVAKCNFAATSRTELASCHEERKFVAPPEVMRT